MKLVVAILQCSWIIENIPSPLECWRAIGGLMQLGEGAWDADALEYIADKYQVFENVMNLHYAEFSTAPHIAYLDEACVSPWEMSQQDAFQLVTIH